MSGDWRRPFWRGDAGAEPGEAVCVDEREMGSRQRKLQAGRHRAEGIFDVTKAGRQVTGENE